jgi:hypothetical protein|tara:strand:+ start:138 stop:1928 length:1791 start_codon:yes stop_codon:yes gene_type:complete
MKKILLTIYKYIKLYNRLPPLPLKLYGYMPSILALIVKYLSTKLKNQALLKYFPLAFKGTYFEKPIYLQKNGYGYYLQYYKTNNNTTAFLATPEMAFYRGEMLLARKMKAQESYNLKADDGIILPISVVNSDVYKVPSINTVSNNGYLIDIKINGKDYQLNNLAQNRYHYLSFKKGDSFEIKSDCDLIIGKPLHASQKNKTEKKLVLLMFMDNFAAKIFNNIPLSKLMPNTYDFFSKGHIFNNNYINGHWTIDSVPTFFTGKYPVNHGVFHPQWPQNVGEKNKLISEYYRDNGYMTFHIGGNQRAAPNYGYTKGFERTVYGRQQPCEEVIAETLEQIRAFPERSQFGFLTFMDLHLLSPIQSISTQIQNSILAHDYSMSRNKIVDGKTKILQNNRNYEERYMSEAKRLDFYLNILFEYIKDNYSNNEILIALVSDHGYLSTDETHVLSPSRISVPFMIRGGMVKEGESNELVENIDVFPILLHFSNILCNSEIDGRLPLTLGGDQKKEFSYTECIFPNQPYEAVVNDSQFKFYFKSESDVDDQGKVILSKFKTFLYDLKTNQDLTNEKQDLVNKYTQVVIQHTNKIQKTCQKLNNV